MQKEIISVLGMKCSGCVDTVRRALRSSPGVINVNVSLTLGGATVQFDERMTSVENLVQAVEMVGFGANDVASTQASSGKGCSCG